jgi:hypothetical protein
MAGVAYPSFVLFFTPKLPFCCAQDNLGVKKVFTASKNPSKSPIMYFARIKK